MHKYSCEYQDFSKKNEIDFNDQDWEHWDRNKDKVLLVKEDWKPHGLPL